jgi:hypothetical protein
LHRVCAARYRANLLGDRAAAEEKDQQLRLERRLHMLVRNNLGQPRKHFVRHRQRLQEWLNDRGGHACRNEHSCRVRVQLGAVDIVVCDPLGKSDELPHLPLQSQCEFAHPCRLGRSDGIGVETLPEHRVCLELSRKLRQVAVCQPSRFYDLLIREADVQRNSPRLCNPTLWSRT